MLNAVTFIFSSLILYLKSLCCELFFINNGKTPAAVVDSDKTEHVIHRTLMSISCEIEVHAQFIITFLCVDLIGSLKRKAIVGGLSTALQGAKHYTSLKSY